MTRILKRLNPEQRRGVLALIEAATDHDGIPPISEHALLHLRHGGDKEDRHILLESEPQNKGGQAALIIGYAHLDITDKVAGPSAEMVIHPSQRGKGYGRELLLKILTVTSPRLWSHGDLPSAQKLAQENAFTRVRTVIQMRRSLTEHLPKSSDELTLRTFLTGVDDEEWLALNNAAFAEHPEQGNWSLSNLYDRVNENWFDAQGFILATQESQIIAFCWTKIHGGIAHSHDRKSSHAHDAIGEIYAVGVSPDFHGKGLGRAITIAGLSHLRRKGLMSAMLYVDAENVAAISLYESLGFREWGRDVMYRQLTQKMAVAERNDSL